MEGPFGEFNGEMPPFESGNPGGVVFPSLELNSQNVDCGRQPDIREAIFEKVRNLPFGADVSKELNIEDPLMLQYARIVFGMKEQIFRVEKLKKLENDKGNPNRRNEIYKILLKNSEHYREMAKEIKNDPKNSGKLWEHHRKLQGREGKSGEERGVLAQTAVENIITNDLHFIFENVSSEKDVLEAVDGVIAIENKNGEKEKILCQVKSVRFDNENSESFDFVKKHMITVVYRDLAKRIKNKSGFSEGVYSKKSRFIERKEKELNKIENKIFLNNENEKAVVIYLPFGNIKVGRNMIPTLNEDGTMHKEIKKIFLEQFNTKILEKNAIDDSKNDKNNKKGGKFNG